MSLTRDVTLREISAATVRQITDLAVAPEQQRFVATNAVSLAEALFTPEAWYRAVYADRARGRRRSRADPGAVTGTPRCDPT
jgi:hypothetical protein